MSPPLLRCLGLGKTISDIPQIELFRHVDFEIFKGQSAAIIGASGSGKTTLLHLMALLDRPSSGVIEIEGKAVSVDDGDAMRRHLFGIVFQAFNLVEDWSCLNNVLLPAFICGDQLLSARSRAEQLLQRMGLTERIDTLARSLSGGEKQRLCMARALLRRPKLILADEFTGNLDRATSIAVQDLLFELIEREQLALILVTHDEELAKRCMRCYRLCDGILRESPK